VNTRDVQSCHDKSFLGAAIGGGPLGGGFVVAAPCGRAPELVAKRGSAARPGTQPASTVVTDKVTAIRIVADVMCRLMPTTVATAGQSGLGLGLDVAGVQVAGIVAENVGTAHPGHQLARAGRDASGQAADDIGRDRQTQLVEHVALHERAE